MKNIYKTFLLAFFISFLFLAQNATAQLSVPKEKTIKTAVYKIKKHGDQNSLTAKEAIDIDKLLVSKKGVLASTTNIANRTVSVKLEDNFPAEEIKKLLAEAFKFEVESFEVTDTKK